MSMSYRHTLTASYIGYITQAIVNNFAPLLFLTFQTTWDIPLPQITLLVTVNFLVQLLVDFLSAKYVDRIGYRPCIVAAHLLSAAGVAGLAIFPAIFAAPYTGLMLAVVLYAIGGGLIEVLISPIVEACPTENKSASMSLLHSFYCWGHASVVLFTTIFFAIFGLSHWQILAVVWALVPFANAFCFMCVPIATLHDEAEEMPVRTLFTNQLFWIFLLLMVCAGASEQAVSQWSSAFAEAGLGVSKTIGDLAGPFAFAILMGLARLFYAKNSKRLPLQGFMMISAAVCILGYGLTALSKSAVWGLVGCGLCGLSVGIMWPGTFSLAAMRFPGGGTAMFAFFALAGDLGCSAGPTLVGLVAKAAGDHLRIGILAAIVFPCLLLVGLWACKCMSQKHLSHSRI